MGPRLRLCGQARRATRASAGPTGLYFLLGLVHDQIGVYDDFFNLGGHSLLAAQVMNRITERFGVDLPLLTLFEQRTVSGLSEALVASVVSTTNEGELGALLDELEGS